MQMLSDEKNSDKNSQIGFISRLRENFLSWIYNKQQQQ